MIENNENFQFQSVYHGSGASFDHFDTEHYGLSGEGSMSFGWGTYLTESEAIARDYADRQNGSGKKLDSLLKKYPDLYPHITPIYNHMSLGDSFEEAKKKYVGYLRENHIPGIRKITKSIEELKAEDFAELFKKDRNLYTVSIPDGKYLEWEKELTENESKHLVENYSNYFEYLTEDEKQEEAKQYVGKTGQEIYSHFENLLGSEKETSTFLHGIGYTGIKYPAGTIHGNGNGAYNYVIFDDADIEIKEHIQFQIQTEKNKSISSDFEPNIGDSEKLSDSILEGEPIKSISTDDFNYDGSNLKEFALEYIRNNPQGTANTKIGEVEISETGLRHSLSHTLYKNKLYSIPAIKDTLENGTYLGVIKDLDGKRQNNYYFAAPISIDDEKNVLFIRVKQVAGRDKAFYIHDVFTLDEIEKVTPYSGELNATQRSLRGATLAKSIIQDYEKNNIIQNNPFQFQQQNERNIALESQSAQKSTQEKSMENENNTFALVDENQAARIRLAHELKENMPMLTEKERAAAIAICEAGASSMGMGLADYINQTFPNGVFGDIEKARNAAHQQEVEINGAVSTSVFGDSVRATIYASRTADFSTWCHELSHVWQAQLSGKLKNDAEKAFQVQNGDWQNSVYTFSDGSQDTSAEAFAYGFEDFLKHKAGEMATEDKKAIFEKFADYMSRTYNGIGENIKISDEIAKVYEAFVQLDDNVLAQAEKAVQMEKTAKIGIPEAERQRLAVREMYQDTDKWMKAPNGKPTNLTEEQWVAVHTPNFKRWFGNWDYDENKKVSIIELDTQNLPFDYKNIQELKDWIRNNLVGESVTIDSDSQKVFFNSRTTKASIKRRGEEQRGAYSVLQELIKNSEFYTFENVDEKKKHSHLKGQDVYYSALRVGEMLYSVRIKIDISKDNLQGAYKDHKIAEINIAPNLYHSQSNDLYADIGANNISLGVLTDFVKPSFSQVIDENGEPLVVYHGSDKQFDIFQSEKSPAYFSQTKDYAESMAEEREGNELYATFLNIRNCDVIELPENEFSDPVIEKPFIENAKLQGKNGIIFTNKTDNELLKDSFYAVFNSNLIKSATDNNGNFDINNESILFQSEANNRVSADFEPDIGDSEELSDSIINGEPIYEIDTSDFVINENEKYKFAARRYIQEHPQGTAHTKIGDIEINKSSLDHSFEHSTYKEKVHVIPALKDVLEQGTYLGVMKDFEGNRINNHYFAAPVKIDSETKIVFIRVREAAGDKSRFYIHDVFTSDEIEKVNSYSGTPVTLRAKTGADLYKSIIQDYEKNNIIQNNPLQFQLVGERSILRMAESEEKERILADLAAAKLMEEKYKNMDTAARASRIRFATGWEKSGDGRWKYELDDSTNRIKSGTLFQKMLTTQPQMLEQLTNTTTLTLEDILEAPELFNVFPFMKNVRVSFYSDPTAFRAVLTPEGIKINTQYLNEVDGEKGMKGVLAHEIQHIIQAVEYSSSNGLHGESIELLYNDMQNAIKAAGDRHYDFDLSSLQEGLDEYMHDFGEVEARNVARRISMTYNERRHNTLESSEDVARNLQFQIIGRHGAASLDAAEETRFRMDNLSVAEEMEKTDRDEKIIKIATGWERGADGEWRYEIDDSSVNFYEEHLFPKRYLVEDEEFKKIDKAIKESGYDFEKINIQDKQYWESYIDSENEYVRTIIDFKDGKEIWKHYVELEHVIDAPELFKAYPQLRDIKFRVDDMSSGTLGQYENGRITLDRASGKSVLLHEIQHAIQDIEGFARGGNENQFKAISVEELKTKRKEIDKKIIEIEIKYFSADEWLEVDKKLRNLSGEEYKNAKQEAVVNQIENLFANKDDSNEYKKLCAELDSLNERIEEIKENALDGQVEIDGNLYANEYEAYRSLSGEVEARNVQRRMNMSSDKRRNTLLSETEDVPRDEQTILNESDQSNEKRNVALEQAYTQGEKTMPGEKQIIAEIGFADGEIRQYEDSVPFLKDLNEATRENAYDTTFRVYADSDELKQKASDVKLDNYDPMEAAERIHNGYEWNDVEHEAVQFTQSAEGRRLLKEAENGRLTMLDARDILDAVEKNGMTLRYDPLPNSYVVDGWTAADGEKLDNYVVSMSELKRLAGIEISENSQQNQIQEKKTARTPEEEQAYQEWLEMLEDNQQAEDRMERMQGVPPEEQKPLPEWQQRLNATINQAAEMDGVKDSLKAVLYENAENFNAVSFSRDGYERLFPNGEVQSPIETIKFAENQFDVEDRTRFMLAAYQTLSNPDLIYSETENTDNLESKNYVKTFVFGEDEKSALDIVVKTIDGEKVMISAQKRSLDDLIDNIKQPEQLIFMSEEIKQGIDRRSPEEKQRLKDVLPKLRIVPENPAYDKEKSIATARNFAAEKRNVALEKKSIDERFDILISYEDKFIKSEKEKLPSEITQQIKDVERQIEEYWYDGKIPKNARFTLPTTPTLAKQLGCNNAEISIPVAVIKKARDVHNISAFDIKKSLTQLYNPVIVFDSDKSKSENKADSRLILTDSFKYEYDDNKAVRDVKPIAFAVNVDSTVDLNNRGLTIEVQDVRSIHDRTLVAKNGTDLIQEWTKKGLCRSIDDKKIGEWSTVAGIYFPLELLNSPKNNILTKTEIVNSFESEKSNVAPETEQKAELDSAAQARDSYNKKYPTDWQIYTKELTDRLNAVSEQIENYLKYGTLPENSRFILPNSPQFMQKIGSHDTQISLPVAVVKKAHETHGLTLTEIQDAVKKLYNPVLAFDSDKSKSENKADSRLLLTDSFTKENKPVALAINVNSNVKLIDSNISAEVQDIRSIHDRTLIAKNGTDLIKKWTLDGLCRYVDDKKISDWSSLARVYFPIELLQSPKNNILTKTEIVNSFGKENTPKENIPQEIKKEVTADRLNTDSKEKSLANKKYSPKEYLKYRSELFLKHLDQGNLPFMKGEQIGDDIIIKVKAVRNASNGRALTGFQQLMAQDIINTMVENKEIPRMDYEIITYEQAKEARTFIKKGSPHFMLPVYNEKTNTVFNQIYYFKSGCNEPGKVDLLKLKIQRESFIGRERTKLEKAMKERDVPLDEKNKIFSSIAENHQAIIQYLNSVGKRKEAQEYKNNIPREERAVFDRLEEKKEIELNEMLWKNAEYQHRIEEEEFKRQKENPNLFNARETSSYEDFLGKTMAAMSIGGIVVTSKSTIDTVRSTLTPVLKQSFDQYDYMKGFQIGEVANGKCKENLRETRNNSRENQEIKQTLDKALGFQQGGRNSPPDRSKEIDGYDR